MQGKRILLGITGGIAAYKIASLIRLLRKSEAEVKCIMTPASSDFISPLVVSALSGNPVGIEFWNKHDGTWNSHVDYGLWADVFVVAPLTANTLSKMASGTCDNLLLATYFSMKAQTIVAPAMDLDMYTHPTTKRNLEILRQDDVQIIPAESGELASGLDGEGRMAEAETIFDTLKNYFRENRNLPFQGKNVLITAGPTYEAIDPVRYIGNHSSGKMGYALANELLKLGAKVELVSGPTNEYLEHINLKIHQVTSAQEMFVTVKRLWSACDVGIFAAAVADYRPEVVATEKIKKENKGDMLIKLTPNPDILKWTGENKREDQCLVGFALETENMKENAEKKLVSKNLDFIVMNTLKDKGAGFAVDTNKISILDKRNNFETFELKAKSEVSRDIVNYLKKYI